MESQTIFDFPDLAQKKPKVFCLMIIFPSEDHFSQVIFLIVPYPFHKLLSKTAYLA